MRKTFTISNLVDATINTSKLPCLVLVTFSFFAAGWKTCAFLENLQTLPQVSASFCTKEVLQELPDLKKLGIWMKTWDQAPFYINNLACLQKLEVLKCSFRSFPTRGVIPLPSNGFPPKFASPIRLKELSLRGCRIPWKDMRILGSLPHYEIMLLSGHSGS
ncbi:hypothetical protein Salat_0182100 [Sesamum alatum]|uniref:Uncharacterized protein n=1 Tax=Sesamum alatum TaxID=300844 RepID=A0AAE1YZ94_9LAMI|nr:hypothetical protein Salat_0182100 [Sesamum alatum]